MDGCRVSIPMTGRASRRGGSALSKQAGRMKRNSACARARPVTIAGSWSEQRRSQMPRARSSSGLAPAPILRSRNERSSSSSEENWRVLAETVPQLVWTTGPDNRLDYCNQRYCEFTHATFEQLQGHGWRQFLHPEEAEGVVALRHQTLQTGEPYQSECRPRNSKTVPYRGLFPRG